MARLELVNVGTGSFEVIPEGNYDFTVTKVEYKEKFGKLAMQYTATTGDVYYDNYTLIRKKKVNAGAQKAMSFTIKAILGDFTVESIDPDEILDLEFNADVVHVISEDINEKTGEPYVNTRLENITAADSDDEDEYDEVAAAQDEFDF